MELRQIGIVGLALALAGCGGGGYGGKKQPPSDPPMELTGVLQAGRVSGLDYATQSRRGRTDDAGTFRYLPGETVTFSIGSFVLGKVSASGVITPFTLAGTTPPATELALRGELDRATRESTPFSRAINIERLLIALDRDNDPANGILLGESPAGLQAGDLDLGLTVPRFASRLRRKLPHLTGNLPNSQPLVVLYRALALQVPVHAVENVVTTLPGVPDYPAIVTRMGYNAAGALASQAVDLDGDTQSDLESTWEYDPLSRVTGQSMQAISIAGQPPASLHVANHFDAGGNLLDSDEQHDGTGSGVPDLRLLRKLVNDDHGFAVKDVVDTDNGADGTIESRRSTDFTFDAHHNLIAMTQELDFGVDTLADERHTVEASYDPGDRQIDMTARTDHDADGVIESSVHDVFEYADGSGSATRQVEEHDFNEDGIADARIVMSSTYDDAGFLLAELNEYDSNGDGTLELISRITFAYDAQHRILRQDDCVDHDADGIFEELDRTTSTYDPVGNPLSVRSEFDVVDGVAGFTSVVTSRYGTFGERLETRTESRLKDAVEFTPISLQVFTNTVIADGVQTLAQQYLDGLLAP